MDLTVFLPVGSVHADVREAKVEPCSSSFAAKCKWMQAAEQTVLFKRTRFVDDVNAPSHNAKAPTVAWGRLSKGRPLWHYHNDAMWIQHRPRETIKAIPKESRLLGTKQNNQCESVSSWKKFHIFIFNPVYKVYKRELYCIPLMSKTLNGHYADRSLH